MSLQVIKREEETKRERERERKDGQKERRKKMTDSPLQVAKTAP